MANEIDVEEAFKLCRTILGLGPVRDHLRAENVRLEGLNKQLAADHAAQQAKWGNLELHARSSSTKWKRWRSRSESWTPRWRRRTKNSPT
jgi:hypothetical protein